jgi:2-hydroxycyclohexanecarboxyl-CoA dehydrogenase
VTDAGARVVVVTGAAGGLGASICQRLHRDGFRVVLVDREPTDDLAADLSADRALAVVADVTRRDEVEAMLATVERHWGKVDILINNAGRTRVGPFVSSPEAHWDELLEVDVKGVLRCCQVVLPGMLDRRWGRIINMASDAARTGLPGQTVYAAAKGAVIAFTRSLAREVGERNVLVNAVSPGPVNTPPLQRLFERQPSLAQKLRAEIPLGEVAEVADVSGAVAFLVSEDARYITGQVLSVNGGWVTA